jgi:multidrug resistance efflux pump
LEADDLLNQIAQAEVALNAAQLLQSEAEKALRQDIASAELDLKVAQTRLEQAQDANAHTIAQGELALTLAQEELDRMQILQTAYRADIVRARVDLERAQGAGQEAEITVAQAQYDRAVAESSGYQREIAMQKTTVQLAEGELARLKKDVDPLLALEVQRAQQALDWLEDSSVDPALVNDVEAAQLTLERLQGQLADAQIVAPASGAVVSLALQPGQPVEAFRTVIVIADPSDIEVRADLSSEQLKQVTEGQAADVVLSTDPDQTWPGTVLRLPHSYGTADSTEGEGQTGRNSFLRVGLEGDVARLKLGDLVYVTIVLEAKDDVLWLPPAAIGTYQDSRFVIVQDGERQRRTAVELGLQGQERVELLTALEEGQTVLAP